MIYYYSERQLSPFEQMRAHEQIEKRTKAMKFAFDIMPQSMKASVELDQALPFNHIAYYPDFMWRQEKVIIEIDGSSHRSYERKRKDFIKDQTCRRYGFFVIRVRNEDLSCKIGFWLKLIEEFSKINPVGERAIFEGYIEELSALVEEELTISSEYYNGSDRIEQILYFPIHTGWAEFSQLINNVKQLHENVSEKML